MGARVELVGQPVWEHKTLGQWELHSKCVGECRSVITGHRIATVQGNTGSEDCFGFLVKKPSNAPR
eukprot:1180626-Rhodomonas_salina.1